MILGLITAATVYINIGFIYKCVEDKSGETTKKTISLFTDAVKWPKDLYDKYKDKI